MGRAAAHFEGRRPPRGADAAREQGPGPGPQSADGKVSFVASCAGFLVPSALGDEEHGGLAQWVLVCDLYRSTEAEPHLELFRDGERQPFEVI